MQNTAWYTPLYNVLNILAPLNNLEKLSDSSIVLNNRLLKMTPNHIRSPVVNLKDRLEKYPSPLEDEFISLDTFSLFVDELKKQNSLVRVNHIGFCYKVTSIKIERQKIVKQIEKTPLHLYEEPSNDAAAWLFIGDVKNWQDPLIELLPVENTNDSWVNLWLPHIHIDIDTTEDAQSISDISNKFFKNSITPFNVTVIEGVIYTVRLRLGIASGINIDLDLATNKRDVEYARTKLWKRVA